MKVLQEFFTFFIQENYIIKTIYDPFGKNKKNQFELFATTTDKEITDQKIKLNIVDKQGMNEEQDLYLNLYYWAAFYNNFIIVNMYLIDLGISPFIQTFKDQTPVHGSVLNLQMRMFLYFVKDCSHGMRPVHDNIFVDQPWTKADRVKNRYECKSEAHW